MASEGLAAQIHAIIKLWVNGTTNEQQCRGTLNALIRKYSSKTSKDSLLSSIEGSRIPVCDRVREHMVPVKVIITSLLKDPKYFTSPPNNGDEWLSLELQLNEML